MTTSPTPAGPRLLPPLAFVLAAAIVGALAGLPVVMGAQSAPDRLGWVPNPTPRGWVSDPAGHLAPSTVDSINAIITALQRDEGAEMAIVVIDTLDGLEPADAALALHRRWGVGLRGQDNGIVVLWSPKQRQTYVSIGYGLEGVLPDARVGRIQDQAMIPAFRDGEFDRGMLATVIALASAAREDSLWRDPAGAGADRGGFPEWLIALLSALGIAGAGGVAYARRPRRCPAGHGPMRRLGERADNAHLDEGQRAEEKVRSVNYNVWQCDVCAATRVEADRRLFSSHADCPKCTHRTLASKSRTLRAATTSRTGREEVTRACAHCAFSDVEIVTIPVIVQSSSGSGSGGGGGGGGGSSFGGGSAGGGGAGRSY